MSGAHTSESGNGSFVLGVVIGASAAAAAYFFADPKRSDRVKERLADELHVAQQRWQMELTPQVIQELTRTWWDKAKSWVVNAFDHTNLGRRPATSVSHTPAKPPSSARSYPPAKSAPHRRAVHNPLHMKRPHHTAEKSTHFRGT